MAEKTKPIIERAADVPVEVEDLELTAEELEAVRLEARKLVAAERKKALRDQALKSALEELRGKEGQRTGDPHEDELVNITLRFGSGADRMAINGKVFFHGQTYTVPRHVARSMLETMWRTDLHEHCLTDKPLSQFYAKPRHSAVSRKGTTNAPNDPVRAIAQSGVN